MHPPLVAFFDLHRERTSAHKRKAHDQLGPLLDVCGEIERHLRDLQSQLTRAELAAHDAGLDGKLEWMHVRLRGGLERAEAFRTTGRDLAKMLVEIDNGFGEDLKALQLLHGEDAA